MYMQLTHKADDIFRTGKKIRIRINIDFTWAPNPENLSSGFVNSKGTDQPARPRRLISAFVIRLLENMIPKLVTSKFTIF